MLINMFMRYCLLFAVIVALVTNVLAFKYGVKHSLTIEEKMEKAKALSESKSEQKEYTGKFVMHFEGPKEEAEKLGERHGFKKEEKLLKNLKGYIIFTDEQNRTGDQVKQEVERMKKEDKRMKSFYEDEKTYRKELKVTPKPLLSFNVTDAHWLKQWPLHKETVPNHGVYKAWEMGYSGKGVVIAIVDNGMDVEHDDLVANYNESLSYNFIHEATGGIHIYDTDVHGTLCAGLAAASKNNDCIIGVAYESTLASLRILDEVVEVALFASSFIHGLEHIDIYSNSYGIPGFGSGFQPLPEVEEAAMLQGVTEGRNGKGAIYMFAAGNDGEQYDDCNAAGHVNSIYTIAINAMKINGSLADYSEECTCIMAAVYGGEGEYLISTTARYNECMDKFFGTSAATPLASGMVALALQANSDLTWRDVQHLIVETSTYDGVPGEVYQTNGAGKNVSFTHGFGIMQADEMVKAALTWKTVPEKISFVVETQSVYECCTEVVEATYDLVECPIKYLEHVQVYVAYRAEWRQHLEIHLVSPNGTDSRLLRQRRGDNINNRVDWIFMTVFNWGEDPTGTWTIRLIDFLNCGNEVHLYTWGLILHGTVTDPHAGIPENGTLGGRCDTSTPCTDGLDCLLNFNICIDCNLTGYRVVNSFCAQDKQTGGYCDSILTCDVDQSFCNVNNTCEVCPTGFKRFDDQCFEDGKLGGYCDYYQECTEVDVGCNWAITRCVICKDGHHVIDGYCLEDGTLLGYCDENVTCDTATTQACYISSNRCIYCDTSSGQQVIDGFCYDDGTMGSNCNESVPCTEAGTGCDLDLNKCIACENDGYHIVDSVCRLDAILLGYCNDTMGCQDGSGCDLELNVCVECKASGYRVVGNGFCEQDGELDGYCDAEVRCKPDRAGCSEESHICVICYEGHHLHDGVCIKGKRTGEVKTEEKGQSVSIIVGPLFGGLAVGVAMTAPVFVLIFRKIVMTKKYAVSQNGADGSFKNINSRFSQTN